MAGSWVSASARTKAIVVALCTIAGGTGVLIGAALSHFVFKF